MLARFVEASIITRNIAVAVLASNLSYTVYYGNNMLINEVINEIKK